MSNETMSHAELLAVLSNRIAEVESKWGSPEGSDIRGRSAIDAVATLIAEHAEDQSVIAVWRGRCERAEAERDARAERVKTFEGALQAIERRTFRHPDDTADDHRRNVFHAHSIAKDALARAQACKPEGGAA